MTVISNFFMYDVCLLLERWHVTLVFPIISYDSDSYSYVAFSFISVIYALDHTILSLTGFHIFHMVFFLSGMNREEEQTEINRGLFHLTGGYIDLTITHI